MSSTKNPWITLSERYVYENPWIRVREDKVVRPDGKEGIYGVVETRIATAVVALTAASEVYLVGQYRYPLHQYSWELVEGGSDEGEDGLAAAKRELREEAGLISADWIQLGEEVHLSNCISSETAFFYIARELSETESEPEGTEILQLKKVPFAEAIRMVESGEIKDAMSIIGLLRAERWLRSNGR